MTVLTEHTREKHKQAESSDFVQYMFTGKITETDYVIYLQQMWHIYSVLESCATSHGLFDGVDDLRRTHKISLDLNEFEVSVGQPYASTKKYMDHLIKLYNTDPDKLMAHIYVRHMGDLYGGKIISKMVPGSGYSYSFEYRKEMVEYINLKLTLELLPEAILGFDYCIGLFDELKIKLKLK